MTTSDSDKENESPEGKRGSKEGRIEKIKKEEHEDASSYYAQGDKESAMDMKKEFENPILPVQKDKEDLNLLRAVAFLGFGLAALAIVFILFFIRDLDERVGGMDSAVKKVEEAIEPLKADVEGSMKTVQAIEANLNTVSDTVSRLKGKLGNYEKSMAIMELKRALAMIQGISMGSDAGVRSKSSGVAASIKSLLSELGGGEGVSGQQPAGEIQVEEAADEPADEEPAGEVSAEATEEPAGEVSAEATEEPAGESAVAGEEEPAGEVSAEATEEPAGESAVAGEEEPAGESQPAEESHEEAPAEPEGHGEESALDDVEELPTVGELLKE